LTRDRTSIGGVTSFVGLVRDVAGGEKISAMTLEHYPGMTEQQLAEIEAEAQRRWPLDAVLIIHRYGELKPGDRIVLVVTASAHRDAAFDACRFLIDWLKTKAPFWKLEETNKARVGSKPKQATTTRPSAGSRSSLFPSSCPRKRASRGKSRAVTLDPAFAGVTIKKSIKLTTKFLSRLSKSGRVARHGNWRRMMPDQEPEGEDR